jgi:hypothetical protein
MLTPPQKAEFANRSAPAVKQAFLDLSANWQLGLWISRTNRYRRHCIDKLKDDFNPNLVNKPVRHRDLLEYIAASVMVHCFDGWAYLGRALGAQLQGDHDCSRHLGYYAELRAAMSILGAHGIGVFDNKHVVVNSKSRCIRMPGHKKTHGFVWEALEEWATTPDARDSIFDSIKAGGQNLATWLNHFSIAPALSAKLAEDWLRDWGLDIKRLAADQTARNLSSYRPTGFTTSRPAPAQQIVKFTLGLWRLCEATTQSPFAELDRNLIRLSLQRAFKAGGGLTHRNAKATANFLARMKSLLSALQPTATLGLDWETFLLAEPSNQPDLLVHASGTDGPESQFHSIQVAARALLLLRVASGTCERLIKSLPRSSRAHLTFWIDAVGEDRRLWQGGDRPTSWQDLWKDPEDAIDDLEGDLPSLTSYAALWENRAPAASVLTTCERVGLWSTLG